MRLGTGESYGIPYRTLLPQKLDNVLVAGRCTSTDRAMQASVRVMPGCYITGQAAGLASARSVPSCRRPNPDGWPRAGCDAFICDRLIRVRASFLLSSEAAVCLELGTSRHSRSILREEMPGQLSRTPFSPRHLQDGIATDRRSGGCSQPQIV